MTIEDLKNKLIENKFELVFDYLLQTLNYQDSEIFFLKARHLKLKENDINGIITHNEKTIEENKIRVGTYRILNKINDSKKNEINIKTKNTDYKSLLEILLRYNHHWKFKNGEFNNKWLLGFKNELLVILTKYSIYYSLEIYYKLQDLIGLLYYVEIESNIHDYHTIGKILTLINGTEDLIEIGLINDLKIKLEITNQKELRILSSNKVLNKIEKKKESISEDFIRDTILERYKKHNKSPSQESLKFVGFVSPHVTRKRRK